MNLNEKPPVTHNQGNFCNHQHDNSTVEEYSFERINIASLCNVLYEIFRSGYISGLLSVNLKAHEQEAFLLAKIEVAETDLAFEHLKVMQLRKVFTEWRYRNGGQ